MKKKTMLLLAGLLVFACTACGTKDSSSDKKKKETISDEDARYYTSLGFEKTNVSDKVPAFLSADGFGKYAIGGRGGQVIEVTNLNDSGEGSLREAINTKGPRTVVFRVSGTIFLESALTIKEPFLTIAGQTAPGDGICVSNFGPTIETHDVIVRYMRSRPAGKYETDALWVNKAKNVIVDHLSTSWGTDETLSVSDSDYVSIQYCLISESLNVNNFGTHGMGSLIRGSKGQKVTYHSNLYSSHRSRLPMAGNYSNKAEDPEGFNVELINNVMYNWSGKAAGKNHDIDCVSHFNLINNYYVPGRKTEGSYIWSEGCSAASMYLEGNSVKGEIAKDQWSLIEIDCVNNDFSWDSFKEKGRFDFTMMDKIKKAEDSYNYLLEHAGASLSRDCIDKAVIESVKNDTGKIINKPEQSVGWSGEFPPLNSTEPYSDADKDGMDDNWETQNGLNPADASDGVKIMPCGYSNLEIFLESLLHK